MEKWQFEIAKRLFFTQIRPDQKAWLEKHESLPKEVMIQFALSAEGGKAMVAALDALINEANKVLTKVAELQKGNSK